MRECRRGAHEGVGPRLRLGAHGRRSLRSDRDARAPVRDRRARRRDEWLRRARRARPQRGAGARRRRPAADAPRRARRAGAGDRGVRRAAARRDRDARRAVGRALHIGARRRRRRKGGRTSVVELPRMVRRAFVIAALVLAAAGCGNATSAPATTTTAPPPPKPFRNVFPEGFTRVQMAVRVKAVAKIAVRERHKRVLLNEQAYLAASKGAVVRCFGRTKRTDLEGFPFPATYDFLRKTTGKQLVAAQLAAFCRDWSSVDMSYARSK